MKTVAIILLIISIRGEDGEPHRKTEEMNTIKECYEVAEAFLESVPPEIAQMGVAAGCYIRKEENPT